MNEHDDTNEELTKEEEERVRKTWRRWARESTRAQIIQNMSDTRSIASTVYEVMHTELLHRDRCDDKRAQTAENKRVWAAATPKQQARMVRRRKLKSWVKSINF